MTSSSAESSLIRALGSWGLAASIFNVTVGGGIFRLPANVASSLGPLAPVAYLVCAGAMALIVLCIAEAGSRVSLTGGPYAYVGVAFGPFVGFISGVLLWVLATFAFAAVSTVFVASAGQLVPTLRSPIAGAVLLALVLALFCTINIRGVKQGARLNAAATIAKLAPLLLFAIVGLAFVRVENLAPNAPLTAADLSRTAIILIFAFAGIESALVPSGEVREPARTVPRGIAIAMVGITVLYILLQVVAQGVLGAELATSQQAPLAEAAARFAGPWARTAMLVGTAISTFGYVSGMTLAVPRALFALARDGFLPGPLARVHPRFHTPYIAIAVQGVVTFILAATSTFERLVILANITVLTMYALCCLAAWQLRRKNVQMGGTPFRVPGAAFVPIAALLVIAWLFTGVTRSEWIALGTVIGVIALLYLVTRGGRAAVISSVP
jgi:basic amino acid/polyamine antiporter, APA family